MMLQIYGQANWKDHPKFYINVKNEAYTNPILNIKFTLY